VSLNLLLFYANDTIFISDRKLNFITDLKILYINTRLHAEIRLFLIRVSIEMLLNKAKSSNLRHLSL
jgi:hypothetical protein